MHSHSQRPIDPSQRNRQGPQPVTSDTPPMVPISSGSDQADVATSPEQISGYIKILKTVSALDLGKVESLKARFRDGSYQAKSSDMSGPLSALVAAPPPPSGDSDQQSGCSGGAMALSDRHGRTHASQLTANLLAVGLLAGSPYALAGVELQVLDNTISCSASCLPPNATSSATWRG